MQIYPSLSSKYLFIFSVIYSLTSSTLSGGGCTLNNRKLCEINDDFKVVFFMTLLNF